MDSSVCSCDLALSFCASGRAQRVRVCVRDLARRCSAFTHLCLLSGGGNPLRHGAFLLWAPGPGPGRGFGETELLQALPGACQTPVEVHNFLNKGPGDQRWLQCPLSDPKPRAQALRELACPPPWGLGFQQWEAG